MRKFNVIIEDINGKKFVPYDVIPYLVEKYNNTEVKPQSFDEFKIFVSTESMYQWWARCEYEVILQSWPKGDTEKKIDVYWQIMMNIDLVTELVMEEVDELKEQ